MTEFAFPIKLEVQVNGAILVSYPDVPEALTEGDTRQDALEAAQDCLISALGGYISRGWPVPVPSTTENSAIVKLPEGVELKLSLYARMLERDISPAMLAKRLGQPHSWVRQLLNLDKFTFPIHLDEAFGAL